MALTHDQFDALMDEAVIAFNAKQEQLSRTFGFGEAERWLYSDKTEKLQLFDASDRPLAEADVIEIGGYNAVARGWLWAWANPGVSAAVRTKSARLKAIAEETGFEIFEAARAVRLDDEVMAWRLTAMAVRCLDAVGAYRMPTPDGAQMAFLAVMSARDLRRAGDFGNTWRT